MMVARSKVAGLRSKSGAKDMLGGESSYIVSFSRSPVILAVLGGMGTLKSTTATDALFGNFLDILLILCLMTLARMVVGCISDLPPCSSVLGIDVGQNGLNPSFPPISSLKL